MDKRIAIITEGFMDSTLPLIRQLCSRGYKIDLYYYKRVIHEPEACELEYRSVHYGINTVPRELYAGISRYIGNENLTIYTFSQFKPFTSVPVVRDIIRPALRHQAYQAARVINARAYDAVNMICNYDMAYMTDMLHFLRGNILLSLHEVWNHANPSSRPSKLLAEAIRRQCKIMLFSDKSRNDIAMIDGINMDLVHANPFGLSDSYASLPELTPPEKIPGKYLLLFGYIRPYKGLGILHEAIDIVGKSLDGYKIVVAGKGDDPVLEKIKNDDRYILIQRFISCRELVSLIKRAYLVMCPYLSMSQSGIPRAAFPFGTPVIASDLDGFREIVTPEVGMLFPAGDAQSLARCITDLIQHPGKREQMHRNILSFNLLYPKYDWTNICDKYIEIIGQ
ncbi:MAG: glycosyltransferase family 4 protein [Bacteroidaceae bacterium]|nr:glycosyltransferase family 4 protein [Bacteroidaceae bacterium]